jgi:hypothetical protein
MDIRHENYESAGRVFESPRARFSPPHIFGSASHVPVTRIRQ